MFAPAVKRCSRWPWIFFHLLFQFFFSPLTGEYTYASVRDVNGLAVHSRPSADRGRIARKTRDTCSSVRTAAPYSSVRIGLYCGRCGTGRIGAKENPGVKVRSETANYESRDRVGGCGPPVLGTSSALRRHRRIVWENHDTERPDTRDLSAREIMNRPVRQITNKIPRSAALISTIRLQRYFSSIERASKRRTEN